MGKFWNVELTYVAVVYAENEEIAWDVASSHARSIVSDSSGPIVDVRHRIKEKKDFRDGWDGQCIAYGGDENTRIAEIDENLK